MVNKDVYVLFADYSQTVINVRFDAKNPSDVIPSSDMKRLLAKLRQDQLEVGTRKDLAAKNLGGCSLQCKNTTVGDGTSHGLIQHLLSPLSDVLCSVGTRSYGALVYANLANASVQQHGKILVGEVISFRNARLSRSQRWASSKV